MQALVLVALPLVSACSVRAWTSGAEADLQIPGVRRILPAWIGPGCSDHACSQYWWNQRNHYLCGEYQSESQEA